MMKIFTYPECQEQLDKFYSLYDASIIIVANGEHQSPLLDPHLLKCRYCGRSAPIAEFKKEAHIISQLLGKNNLLCDYECDDCNATFSSYESGFANWLGITRTLVGTKNRKDKVPEFLSATGAVRAHTDVVLDTTGTKVTRQSMDPELMNIDPVAGKTTITYIKRPYVPFDVFRVLLKIAFSALPKDEVDDYELMFRQLIAPVPYPDLQRFAHVLCFHLPMDQQAIQPYGLLFKKRNPLSHIPLHFFVFYYANHVYSFPLPFSNADIKNGCYTKLESYFPPPIFFEELPPNSIVSVKMKPMGALETVKDDQEVVSFEFDPKAMENLVAFDPKTGKTNDINFDPDSIVSLFFVEPGTSLKLPELPEQQ